VAMPFHIRISQTSLVTLSGPEEEKKFYLMKTFVEWMFLERFIFTTRNGDWNRISYWRVWL